MKLHKIIMILFCSQLCINAVAQNVALNLLTQNTGQINVGGTVFLQVDVTNTDLTGTVVQNKVTPQISIPAGICLIAASGHSLASGWQIISNSGTVIRIRNTTDPIPPNTTRTSLIAIEGTAAGNGSITGNLTFNGPAPAGDNTADNSSSSGIQVNGAVPVTLTDFSAKLINCEPSLKWITETEINSDRFEIERGNITNTTWSTIGVVAARGYSNNKTAYSFADGNLTSSTEKILYRLKVIDKDGRYQYSKTLPVFVNCKTTGVYVYPNPVKDGKLFISLTGTTGYAEATLISLSGQVIRKDKMNNGTNNLNVLNVASGTYVLNIKDINGVDKKVKVFIQN